MAKTSSPPATAPPAATPFHTDALVERPKPGINTVTDILFYNARDHGTRNALGWRDIVDMGKGLVELGLDQHSLRECILPIIAPHAMLLFHVPPAQAREPHFYCSYLGDLHLLRSTWQLMQHACMYVWITIATTYDTHGESGLTHSPNKPGCVGVFTNAELLPVVQRVLPNTATIKVVIYDGNPPADLVEKIKAAIPDREVHVLSQDELRKLGKGKPEHEDRHPKAEDVACIMYTSGTTGAPKGVVLSQANLIAAVGAIQPLVGYILTPEQGTLLAFLPLAHILEYVVELALGYVGLQIGYGRIRTLTDASVRNCQGDLKECKPTIMIGVPQIWETIRKGILNNVNKMTPLKKSVFRGSMSIKKANVPILSNIVDSVVFSQVEAQTGCRLRYVLNGGAALSVETQ